MNLRLLGLTIAAGLATVIIVGVAVTELLQSQIEFSLLVGIPVGLFAGAVVAALVAWGTTEGAPTQRRRVAIAFGAFATSFLAVLAAGVVLPIGTVLGITLGIGVGVVVAIVSYWRTTGRTLEHPDGSPLN